MQKRKKYNSLTFEGEQVEIHQIILVIIGIMGCLYTIYSASMRIIKKELSKEMDEKIENLKVELNKKT